MPAPNATSRGKSALWIAKGFTVTDGEIVGGTPTIDSYNFVKEISPEYAASADAATTTFEVVHAGRVKVQYPEITTIIDGITGDEKEGSGGAVDKLSAILLDTLPTTITKVKNYRGVPVIVCGPHGVTSDGSVSFYYLLAKLTSSVKVAFNDGGVSTLPIEFSGVSYVADSTGDTSLSVTFPAITPIGGTAITPPALVSGDLAALKAGKLVIKTVE